jgi:hypothetical protein
MLRAGALDDVMDRERGETQADDAGERAATARAPGRSPRTARLPVSGGAGAPVQAKAEPRAASAWGDADASASADPFGIHLQDQGGDRMPVGVQRKMEASFAADFSGVRIHEGGEAAAIGAVAYAQGKDLHFAPGEYQPDTQAGQELIGHELGHVVQQAEGRVATPGQAKGAAINEDPGLEREADEMGARAARGEAARSGGGAMMGSAGGVVQAKYAASGKQKTELKSKIGKWGKEYMDGGGEIDDLVQELADYFDDHGQALRIIGRATYTQWSDAQMAGTGPSELEDQLLGGDGEAEAPKKKKDPIAEVKKKLTAKGMDLALFAKADLEQIDREKETDGWETAIANTYQRVLEAKQNADLRAKLIQDYAADKAAGDLIFTAGLLAAVWNLSYQIAISPVANINTTVAGEYADGVILAAVPGWRGQGDLTLVTQFHVPGGGAPIEDKSTRAVNPDPTRGRQCDFVSYWKGNKINVHVDSTQHH